MGVVLRGLETSVGGDLYAGMVYILFRVQRTKKNAGFTSNPSPPPASTPRLVPSPSLAGSLEGGEFMIKGPSGRLSKESLEPDPGETPVPLAGRKERHLWGTH